MRWVSLLLALSVAPLGLAQDVVPDTTDPASYYPLALGNQWEYEPEFIPASPDATHLRQTVIADTLIDGKLWFILRNQGFRGPGYGWERMHDTRGVVRFDPDSAAVLWWKAGEVSWGVPCRMDGPMGDSGCEPGRTSVYRRKHPGSISIGSDVIETIVLGFDGAVPGPYLAAGVGVLGGECEGGCAPVLVYASVRDSTYGATLDGMPHVPDLTPPWEYYPLSVGNVWEYERCDPPIDRVGPDICVPDQRIEIVGDTIAAGTQYVARTTRSWTEANAWSPVQGRSWVRFDTTSSRIMTLSSSGGEQAGGCQLDADFSTYEFIPCQVWPRHDVQTRSFAGGTVKSMAAGTDSGETYEAGIGLSQWGVWFTTWRVTFARIHQPDGSVKEAGQPVSVASPASPMTDALTLRAVPSPTTGPLTLALDLPEPKRVELAVFDALGRRVWNLELVRASGRQRVEIDTGAWAPGLYVVRALAGDAISTATVVRR